MPFAQFAGKRYLSLETFRKNGQAVRTPVWFASRDLDTPKPLLYVYTLSISGKAKRIRNNPRVRVAPCDVRGGNIGQWSDGRAQFLQGDAAAQAMHAIDHKYYPWKLLLDIFAAFRPRERAVFAIRPE
ncbi:MAG TPA: PPOX class F420-dependent oxidoreductase [Candidatus Acidoferrales bacterium]|nr:PPOX class F420-dependent oxidoreductase [Candidatus Acidoferrales bacterium]